MKSRIILVAIALTTAGLITFKLVSNKKKLDTEKKPVDRSNVRIPVKTDTARTRSIDLSIVKTGNLVPFRTAKAVAGAGGILENLHFELGDHVTEGEILASVDSRAQRLDLEKALSKSVKAQNDLDKYSELLEGHAATQEKVDQLKQDLLDAQNEVSHAKKSLTDVVIRSPVSGIITDKKAEAGVEIATGSEIASIVNLSKVKVQVKLTESEVYKIQPGQNVRVTTDIYPGKQFNGHVSYISPEGDQTHNYLTEIEVNNHEDALLRAGTFVYVDFTQKTHQEAIMIARSALTDGVKGASVYIVKDSLVFLRPVQTGAEWRGEIQIIKGLEPGETVVSSGQINLSDSAKISVTK